MPYLPIAPLADDRRTAQGCPPIQLTNCMVRRTPIASAKARRAPFFICRTPGRVLRATMASNVRGLFSAKGCRSGRLAIASGSFVSEMTSSLSYTNVGAISGSDDVTIRADRADWAIRAFGELYRWNGSAFTNITDADAPDFSQTLAVVARRWVAAFEDNDAFGWSVAGDPTDWPTNNQAQDQDMPDPIVGQENIGGDLWNFNAESTEPWQPTGGAETSAFAKVPGARIPIGLAGRSAVAQMGGGAMLLGHTRQVFGTSGYDLTPVPNPALESALTSLTEAQLGQCAAWSYRDPGKEFWGLNAGLELGHVYDGETGLWHCRARYGANYDVHFATSAFGKRFVASRNARKVWSLEDDVYTDGVDDDGEDIPLIADMTVHIQASGDVPVDRLVFDIVTFGVPLEGQGSSPVMRARTSSDNGENWSNWRDLALPTAATGPFHVQDFAWGLASNQHGMLVQISIADPIGFNIAGVWVNPSEQELNS